MQRLRVPIILVAGLCTTCRSEQVLVAIRINATFLPLRPYCEKMCRLPVSWTMQKVQEWLVARFDAVRFLFSSFVEHYNYILLCDWVPEPYSVILRTCAGHIAFVLYQGSAWVGRAVASGGASGARPPHLKSVHPHFTFGPLFAAYIQYSILKTCPPSGFWLLLVVFAPPAAKSWRRACGLDSIF